jgi:methylmalonyl-CoA/ethylmalonyl-CoA epimerase
MIEARFRHLGVAVPDIRRALPIYCEVLGYKIVGEPIEDAIQKVRVCFLEKLGSPDPVIELVEPLSEDSPVGKVIAKGIGAYHVCYEVQNVDSALAEAGRAGCLIVAPPVPAAAFSGRRIAWFYTPTRQLMEIIGS